MTRRQAQVLVEQAVEHGKTMSADGFERAKAEEAAGWSNQNRGSQGAIQECVK